MQKAFWCAVALTLSTTGANSKTWECEMVEACDFGGCVPLEQKASIKFEIKDDKFAILNRGLSPEFKLVGRTPYVEAFAGHVDYEYNFFTLHSDGTLITSTHFLNHNVSELKNSSGTCKEQAL